MANKFNKAEIEALQPRDKRYSHLDPSTRGLQVYVYPSGTKSFVHVRFLLGQPRRTVIGLFPEISIEQARSEASKLNSEQAEFKRKDYQGAAPWEKSNGGGDTFGDLLENYITKHVPKTKRPEKTEYELRNRINTHLASWLNRKASTIRDADVRREHSEIGRTHRAQANRVMEDVRSIFNFSIKEEKNFSGVNPVIGLKFFDRPERERFLQAEELPKFGEHLKDESQDFQDYVSLALWVGARKADVLSLRWENVHLADNRVDIPKPKTKPYPVPLTPEAIRILSRRLSERQENNPWVFPSRRGSASGHIEDLKKQWKSVLKKCGIRDLRQHDLRRTLGSYQAAQGTSLAIIGKSLGHTAGSDATAIYARLDLDPVRASMTTATAKIAAAMNGKLLAAPKNNGSTKVLKPTTSPRKAKR